MHFRLFWLNLQTRYDLAVQKDRLGASLETIRPPPVTLSRRYHPPECPECGLDRVARKAE